MLNEVLLKHILGMVKSNLDFKGAKGPRLELDYLRLVYAVKEMRKQGDNAQGYLVVMTDEMLNRVSQWEDKYRGRGHVEVISASLAGRIRYKLEHEKATNVAGMIEGLMGDKAASHSNANIGREIGEDALNETILRLEPNVQRVRDENRFPLGIRWDFYGVVG